MRKTRKQNTIGNPNAIGYANTSIFKEPEVYDPNDTARPTIKETLIHDNRTGNYNRDVHKPTVYDPNDVARTTVEETLIHDARTGHFNRSVVQDGQGYLTNEKEAPNTNRQFTSDYEYEGIANASAVVGGEGRVILQMSVKHQIQIVNLLLIMNMLVEQV